METQNETQNINKPNDNLSGLFSELAPLTLVDDPHAAFALAKQAKQTKQSDKFVAQFTSSKYPEGFDFRAWNSAVRARIEDCFLQLIGGEICQFTNAPENAELHYEMFHKYNETFHITTNFYGIYFQEPNAVMLEYVCNTGTTRINHLKYKLAKVAASESRLVWKKLPWTTRFAWASDKKTPPKGTIVSEYKTDYEFDLCFK